MRIVLATVIALIAAAPAVQAADSWGIPHEQEVRFEATVVDILCELTGDCPANCGDGERQLGLLRDDGTLIPAVKNYDLFAGAVRDLLPFCGRRIVADGLLIDDPEMRLMMLQFKREAPDGEWRRANWFTRDWGERHEGDPEQWFRHDPTVREVIEAQGVLGIPGLEPTAE